MFQTKAEQRDDSRRVNILHNIKVGDDVKRTMISTTGQSFDAKDITVGDRTVDYNGQMSDQTAQCIARAHSTIASNAEGNGMADERKESQYSGGRRLGGS